MSKQNGANIPDYSSFHREINDTSSPVHHNNDDDDNKEEKNNLNQSSSSSSSASSKKAIPQFETTIPDKTKLNSYASTDEDVDEVNLDYPEDINQSTQIYRDRLNAHLHVRESFQLNFLKHMTQALIFSVNKNNRRLKSMFNHPNKQRIKICPMTHYSILNRPYSFNRMSLLSKFP